MERSRNNFKTSVLKMGQRGRKGKGERERNMSEEKSVTLKQLTPKM